MAKNNNNYKNKNNYKNNNFNNNNKILLLKRDLIKFKSIKFLINLLENYYIMFDKKLKNIIIDSLDEIESIENGSVKDIISLSKLFKKLIIKLKKNNYVFKNKELDSYINKIYEKFTRVKKLSIDDTKINFIYNKEFYESLNNEHMLKSVDLVAPIYEEGLIQFIYGEPKSSKTSVLCYKIMHIVKNRKKKAAVVLLNERHADAKKYASISQDCEVYSLAWDNPDLIGVNKTQKFKLFNEIFERITADPTINYIIIDSLSRLYELLENVGMGEDEDTKEGGQKYTCRDYIRDNYICKINQYNKSLIATLLLEGKNSLNTKVAKYLKGLGNSDVELSAYLLSKGLFPPVNKNSSSTRDILSLLNEKDFSEDYKSFIRWYEKEFRADKADFEKALVYTSYPYEINDGDIVIDLDNSPLSENFEFRSLLD